MATSNPTQLVNAPKHYLVLTAAVEVADRAQPEETLKQLFQKQESLHRQVLGLIDDWADDICVEQAWDQKSRVKFNY